MQSTQQFYACGLGDRLLDPMRYPAEIVEYLQEEERIVTTIEDSFDLLIEVGCVYGRYLDWAIAHKKSYIGIDIVERYVQDGRQILINRQLPTDTFSFIVGDAETLGQIIQSDQLPVEPHRCLLLFPFNSFGNMSSAERVLQSLRTCNLPFIISSYQTTDYANASRHKYYESCEYRGMHMYHSEKGVRFTSPDGLNAIAYRIDYLLSLLSDHEHTAKCLCTMNINAIYTNIDLQVAR